MPPSPKYNILIAWPYMKKSIIKLCRADPAMRVLLDSGAFTAWKQGKVFSVDDYCRFLDETGEELAWRYFALDVVGDPAGTLQNLQTMLDRGYKPIPVFTRGEDPSVLEDYYAVSDLVAIGGLVGTKGNRGYVKGIMKKVGNRKVHWLGFAYKDFVYHYRPYSFDSSSQSAAVRFGVIAMYMGRGRWQTFRREDFLKPPTVAMQDLFHRYGFDPRRAQDEYNWGGPRETTITSELGFKAWALYQKDLEKNTGVRLFFPTTSDVYLNFCTVAFRFWEESTEADRHTFWHEHLPKTVSPQTQERRKGFKGANA